MPPQAHVTASQGPLTALSPSPWLCGGTGGSGWHSLAEPWWPWHIVLSPSAMSSW